MFNICSKFSLLVVGILKGFDPLVNIVLDKCVEHIRDPVDQTVISQNTRNIGLVVCRGTSVIVICPEDGAEEIENPFNLQ